MDGSSWPFNGCPMSVVDPTTPILPPGCFTLHNQTMDTLQPRYGTYPTMT